MGLYSQVTSLDHGSWLIHDRATVQAAEIYIISWHRQLALVRLILNYPIFMLLQTLSSI